jgi:hypothetical protein
MINVRVLTNGNTEWKHLVAESASVEDGILILRGQVGNVLETSDMADVSDWCRD